MENKNSWLEEKNIEKGKILGHTYYICTAPMEGALNGYIHFKRRPLIEEGYCGIATYVPVHGGITYAREDDTGIVYGFDTLHCDSEKEPRTDKEWIKKQIKLMLLGILEAKKVEKKYLTSKSNKVKAKLCQQVLNIDKDKNKI